MAGNIQEIEVVLNELKFYGTGTVTGTAQTLQTIFSTLGNYANIRTLVIHNTDVANIYFGGDASVTTSNGIPIGGLEAREIPIKDINNQSIYLIGSGSQNIRLEVWT